MKTFALASLLVFLLLITTTLLAEKAPPWHWDDEEPTISDERDLPYPEMEMDSDIGW